MTYQAPIGDISFALDHIAGFSKAADQGLFEGLDFDTAQAILQEAARFADHELAPTYRKGDVEGARLVEGRVVMHEGAREVYHKWVEGGWGSVLGDAKHGGQGLPLSLAMAVNEIWNGANMAFALNPTLTQAGVEALIHHGSEDLKRIYLPKMMTGEWTGSMQLTEPHAGSDLRFLKTRAVPASDGSYRLTGTKIFITYGEHPLTDNIIHLVLARLPDAPLGTKGISLFLVPKFLVNADGSLGARNDVVCGKVEHKLGIHGSPTCVMNYGDQGGAVGWLVGEPHRGLNAMFTMMIAARIGVGIQGVGIAERAFQQALQYAHDRHQGTTDRAGADASVAIIEHPDVQRMLLTMKVKTMAARAICYVTSMAMDLSRSVSDETARKQAAAEGALLTPVAKAFSTDIGVEVASDGLQVHGGMGYIEETGAAQIFRDARIAPIYEGTNGIQAIDLVTRKIGANGGGDVARFIGKLKEIAREAKEASDPSFKGVAERLEGSIAHLEETTHWLVEKLGDCASKDAALAGATPYARLFGLTAGGAFLAKGALSAARAGEADAKERAVEARYFAESLLGETSGLRHAVLHGHEALAESRSLLRKH